MINVLKITLSLTVKNNCIEFNRLIEIVKTVESPGSMIVETGSDPL